MCGSNTPSVATAESLQNTVRSIGYDLVIEKENRQEIKEEAQLKHLTGIRKRFTWSAFAFCSGSDHRDVLYGHAVCMATGS